ncbi:MAG: OB-fold domain-containing protein [Myxococcota bacterium]
MSRADRVGADEGLEERLRSFVGATPTAQESGRDEVNRHMIRHWCEAMGDENPVYTDAEFAARSIHGQIVAPPTMLQSWTQPGLPGYPPTLLQRIYETLDNAGFTGVVATDYEQEYLRYLRLGDRVSLSIAIEEVSEQKQTALGTGYFVTAGYTFRDEPGETVGTLRFRILKFRPQIGAAPPAMDKPRWPRPAINSDNAFFWEGIDREQILIQRCSGCGSLRHPPRPMCPSCQSAEWDTLKASGRGTVFSFVVPHHPQVPPFEFPLVVVLVELEEGTRLISNLVGVDPSEIQIGMAVEVEFAKVEEDFTLPRFRPAGRVNAAKAPRLAEKVPATKARALTRRATTLRASDVKVGDRIPPLELELTPTTIIASAIASRDYQDVHHDRDAAQRAGSKDVFMNILSTNGFLGRYVTDWAGPEAILRKVAIRLGPPNYPGDTCRIAGEVVALETTERGASVQLELSARNAYGDHATAAVTLTLPEGS